jgi:hypothetical protein
MSDDYTKYEADCKKIKKQNKKLLDEFALSLQKADLKQQSENILKTLISISMNIFCMKTQQKRKREFLVVILTCI